MTEEHDLLRGASEDLRGNRLDEAAKKLAVVASRTEILSAKQRASHTELQGDLALKRGDSEAAVHAYRELIRIEEDLNAPAASVGNSWIRLGNALAATGAQGEACAAFEQGLALQQQGGLADHHRSSSTFDYAKSLEDMGRWGDATDQWKRAAELAAATPASAAWLFVRAAETAAKANCDARPLYRRAVQALADLSIPARSSSRSITTAAAYRELLKDIKPLQNQLSTLRRAHAALGRIHADRGDWGEAIDAYESARRVARRGFANKWVVVSLGRQLAEAYAAVGRPTDALALLVLGMRTASSFEPEHPQAGPERARMRKAYIAHLRQIGADAQAAFEEDAIGR